jgi:N-methylhydantoinase A
VSLDPGRAAQALDQRLASPAGIGSETAAAGVVRIVEQHLLHAVERISLQRGHDPRELTLVACGGAGPMHGASVGRRLGIRTVYVPRQAGAFCALGMQYADVRQDFVAELGRTLDDSIGDALEPAIASLTSRAHEALDAEGFTSGERRFEITLDMHYAGQQWDVRVTPTPDAPPSVLRGAFEAEHDRLYGHVNPTNDIIVSRLRLSAIGTIPEPGLATLEPTDVAPVPYETRPVYSASAGGPLDTPIHRGPELRFGQSIVGPAVIEEATTTIVVDVGDAVTIDALDNYVIEIDTGTRTETRVDPDRDPASGPLDPQPRSPGAIHP